MFISGGEEGSVGGEEGSLVGERRVQWEGRRVRRWGRGGFISGERSVWVKSSSLEDRSVTTEGVEVGSEGFDHQCR